MLFFIRQCGVFGWPLLIISIVNVVLVLVSVARLSKARPEDSPQILYGIHAVLFWGALSAVLGFLGQHSGLYKALTVISQAQEISPNLVAQGFAESLTTTIFGLVVLVLSALAWYALYGWHRRLSRTWNKG